MGLWISFDAIKHLLARFLVYKPTLKCAADLANARRRLLKLHAQPDFSTKFWWNFGQNTIRYGKTPQSFSNNEVLAGWWVSPANTAQSTLSISCASVSKFRQLFYCIARTSSRQQQQTGLNHTKASILAGVNFLRNTSPIPPSTGCWTAQSMPIVKNGISDARLMVSFSFVVYLQHY